MRRAAATAALAALTGLLLGGSCGGGTGGGGDRAVRQVQSVDTRCTTLSSFFPPGFDFLPGSASLGWVVDPRPPTFVPFDVERVPPQVPSGLAPLLLPSDSDGDGLPEVSESPEIDDIHAVRSDLALVTASDYEVVIFFDPSRGELRQVEVLGIRPRADFPFLPPPGSLEPRTGVSTRICVRPPPGSVDSTGSAVSATECADPQPSYFAGFTSGAAVVGERLFVSMSNLERGGVNPVYRPGAVLVFDIDLDVEPPFVQVNRDTRAIFTTGFNPTHVTAYEVGTRSFALVTVSGAIGLVEDDPNTSEIEAGGVPLTEAAIDVIDADSLQLVATIPLGLAGLSFDRLAIDPTGRVATTGSASDRVVYAVDLEPLESLDAMVTRPVVLDGSEGSSAIIFDAATPLEVPPAANPAPAATCPGFTVGTAFNTAGDRLYVTEFCDGTLSQFDVDLSGAPPVPVPRDRFTPRSSSGVVAPVGAGTLGQPRALGSLEVRPGVPGVDYSGPDLVALVGQPGLVCGIRVESR